MSDTKMTQLPNPKNPQKPVVLDLETGAKVKKILSNEGLSKSEKIRQIMATGVSQYKCAQLMGVIPQFVNNVVNKAKAKTEKATSK